MARSAVTKPPDFTMVELDPPPTLTGDQKRLKANLDAIREQASGKWYRIGRFEGKGAAGNRASAFRKKEEYALYEFKGVPLEDGPDEDGYCSELYCRWIGAPGQSGHRDPQLRALAGGGGEPEEEPAADPSRRGPGRPPKQS